MQIRKDCGMVTVEPGISLFDPELQKEKDYWVTKLSGEIERSDLWLDYSRPDVYSGHKDAIEIILSE
jgi:hypothetical protein